MHKFINLGLLLLLAQASMAQKSAIAPFHLNSHDKELIASIIEIPQKADFLEELDKGKADRFKNMIVDADAIYKDVEVQATFSLKSTELKRFIKQHLVKPKGSEGEVVLVRFLVDRTGEINNIHVLASGADPQLATEAVNVVKKMNKWIPAQIHQINVASYYVLPISF